MEKNSKSNFLAEVEAAVGKGLMPEKFKEILIGFYRSYEEALNSSGTSISNYHEIFRTFLKLIINQCQHPHLFPAYSERILHPFNYYQFGLDFVRPLVDLKNSSLRGQSHLKEIVSHLKNGDNVILLANHQIEGDPQAISILLEEKAPKVAEEMIFVAGERVITDPMAIPFSMGRNLLCIYSKRYIDNPPEQKEAKQFHNKKTMDLMSSLLSEGGRIIYVAPSGGRDRPNQDGVVEVAPFDPQSLEMFYLMAKKATKPTHFYPLALKTYDLLPPPQTIQIELGEQRLIKRTPIHLSIGKEVDMDHFPGSDAPDKKQRRKARADYIWNLVKEDYSQF